MSSRLSGNQLRVSRALRLEGHQSLKTFRMSWLSGCQDFQDVKAFRALRVSGGQDFQSIKAFRVSSKYMYIV